MTCRAFRPDHNGECLDCDEPYDAHFVTFEIRGDSIVCLMCGAESFNINDRTLRYCGACKMFHETVSLAREAVALGGTHDCGEWRTANGRCALCDRALP
jgi:hypothetical protein